MQTLLSLVKRFYPYLLLTAAWYVVYPFIFDAKLFLGGDNANYYILAQGLSSGEGFTQISSPAMSPGNHFPPGYPFIMSLFMRLGFEDLTFFKWLNGFFLLGATFIFYEICKVISKHTFFSFAIALFMLFNAHLLEYSTIMMSEIPFLFLQLACFFGLLKWHENDYSFKSVYGYLFLFFLIASIYTRTIGVALFGAALLYLLIGKRWKVAGVVFAVTLAALAPWQIRSQQLGGSSYVKQLMRSDTYKSGSPKMELADWGIRLKSNSGRYLSKEIPNSLVSNSKVPYHDPKTRKMLDSTIIHWVIGILAVVFGLIGLFSLKRFRMLLLFLFGGNFLIYLLWPQVWFGVRFMLPMIPFIVLFVFLGLRAISMKLAPKTIKYDLLIYGAIAIVCIYPTQSHGIKKLMIKAEKSHPKNWDNYLKAARWSKQNLDKGAVLCSRKSGLFYVDSHRKGTGFPYTEDQGEVLASLTENGVTHVVIEQLGFNQTGKYLLPTIKKNQPKFKLVHSIDADKKNKEGRTKAAVWIFSYDPTQGYQGEFENGLKAGKGKFIYPDGQIMDGIWVNDTLQGDGMLSRPDGYKFIGEWVDGKREGRFIINDPKGNIIETYWEADVIQTDGYLLDETGQRTKLLKMK